MFLAVVLGAPLLQPAAFPRRAGAEECRGVGQTGPDRRQRDARQGGGRHRSADAGQQPGTRSVEGYGVLFLIPRLNTLISWKLDSITHTYIK